VFRRDLAGVADAAEIFKRNSGDSSFIELNTKERIGLNRVLRARGFNVPDDDDIDTKLYLAAEKHDLVSVLFLDLDNFKSVNDNYNHSVGDQVIKESLEVVQVALQSEGLVQRRGEAADEMNVILPNLNDQLARTVAERIRATIEGHEFSVVGRGLITVTIGLATYPETCSDLDSLFDKADAAAMRAKKQGCRNSVTTCMELFDKLA
jgi:diguanylate cyclase